MNDVSDFINGGGSVVSPSSPPQLTSDNEVPGLEPGLGLLKLSGVEDGGGRAKCPSPLEKGMRWLKVSLGGGP